MRLVAALVDGVERALRIAAAACLIGMLVLVVAQVALRYGGTGVPAATEELARYAMIWMALLAAAVCVREGLHIRIDTVPLLVAGRAPALGRALEALVDVLCLTLFVVLFWQGIDVALFAHGQRSEGLRIPLSYPTAALPLAFGAATLFALARLLSRNRAR